MVGSLGILVVLLLAVILLLPYLINLDPVRQKILANISGKVGGDLQFERADLSFFPRPLVVIHEGSLSIPGKVTGTLESLTAYPEILPLLRGRLQIALIKVESPDVQMMLPERPKEKAERPKAFSVATLREELGPLFGLLESKAPGLAVKVDKGSLDIVEGNVSIFRFEGIQARIGLPPERLQVDFTCKSTLWESLSLEGWLNSKDLTGMGSIDLAHFQLERLPDHLFPSSIPRVTDSRVDVSLRFQTDGLKTLQAEVQGSIPYVRLRHENKELALKGKSLRGALHVDEKRATLSLTELDLEYPELSMSGQFLVDQTVPKVSVELEAREVDVASTRQAVLALGRAEPTIQEIFDLVRGGKVPLITLNARGRSLAELDDTENIFIKGSMFGGNIFIRGGNYGWEGVDLNLEDAKGDVVISKGILEGKNLEARWENAKVREGTLRLGLEGKDAPFHLEAAIEVDLSQLTSLLKRLIEHKTLAAELARIYEIKGKGVGRFVVGERIDSITARVDVSELDLFARHDRIPYGLQVNRGKVLYDGQKIDLMDLNGKFGKSSFSEISAQLSFGEVPGLEILSGRFRVRLEEIYSWLSSFEGLDDVFKDIKSVSGTLGLSTLNLKGPLLSPEDWRFKATGEVENLALDSTLFPGPVAVDQGQFEATPEKLMFKDTQTRILDASLQVSGVLSGYQEGVKKADFTTQGNLGHEIMEWGASLIDLPPKLKVRSPLSISQAHVSWDRNGKILISGDLAVENGPSVSVDALHNPEELVIKRLFIQDDASQAAFAATLKERELHLNYRGHLDRTTLNRLLVRNEILSGRFDGDFEAHILLDRPMRSTAEGKLQGVGLGHPLQLKIPLVVENFSVKAEKSTIKVESALITWGESHINLDGDLRVSEEDFLFDMNLSADGIEWDHVEQILEEKDQESDLIQQEDIWSPVVEGVLRVKLGYFEYENFTWKPFHASISLDDDGVEVRVTEANLCGISTPGTVKITPQDLLLDFKPAAGGQELESTLVCLLSDDVRMTGNFEFKGDITAQGKSKELVESLRGDLEFNASDGHIRREVRLARVLGFLNLTEVLTGRLPDMGKEGLAYDLIQVRGILENGKLMVKEAALNGKTLEIAAQGEIDLINQNLDLTVLVAPQKTVDRVVKRIPGVRYILGGTLISYPVRVRGDLKNPNVSALSASAVGSELFGILKRTVKLPIKVVQPILPGREKEE